MQILHIGTGAFFRAHQAWYLHRLIEKGDTSWSYTAGSIRNDTADLLRDLAAQDGVYALESVSPDGKRTYEQIRSIRRVIPQTNDCEGLIEAGGEADVRIVSFTVTEAGYCFDAQHNLDPNSPGLQADLAGGKTTIYGVVAAILAKRRAQQAGPLTILNCDNLRHNGDRFRQGLFEFFRLRGDDDVATWAERNTSFPNSMVDRITPRPSAELSARVLAATGITDRAPVMSEAFVQWVIEDRFCAGRPAWQLVGADLVDSVLPYEEAKIRILNAAHSCLAWYGTLRGMSFIHESISNAVIRQAAFDFITNDVIPTLEPSPLHLPEYRDIVLERFSSEYVKDTNQRVAADSYAKVPGFIVPTLRDLHARGASYDATAFLLALFYTFLQSYNDGTLPWQYQDALVNKQVVQAMFASTDPVAAFCADERLFGDLVGRPEIEQAIRRALTRLAATHS